jgi:hypothetical protein
MSADRTDADLALLRCRVARLAGSLPNVVGICQDWVLFLCGGGRADPIFGIVASFGEALVTGDSGS